MISVPLVVLCVAAFALVALVVSLAVAVGMPVLDRVAGQLSPAQRARLWLGVAGAPGALATLAVGVSLLPALGLGVDHCLAHDPHHPHLCPHHLGGAPGAALVVLAVAFAGRALFVLLRMLRDAHLSRGTSRELGQAGEAHDGALVFDSQPPQAFVLGTLRPRVHVSRGLLALDQATVGPVLAHERAHVRRRDPLWRALCILACGLHLPAMGAAIRLRLSAAQEMSADDDAAAAIGDRAIIAQALLTMARRTTLPAPGMSITHGDLQTRVRALLQERITPSRTLPRVAAVVMLAGGLALGRSHHWVHHTLETLLGTLS